MINKIYLEYFGRSLKLVFCSRSYGVYRVLVTMSYLLRCNWYIDYCFWCLYRADSLYEEVVVCNSLRRALDGRVAFVELVWMLNHTIGLVDFFIQVHFMPQFFRWLCNISHRVYRSLVNVACIFLQVSSYENAFKLWTHSVLFLLCTLREL